MDGFQIQSHLLVFLLHLVSEILIHLSAIAVRTWKPERGLVRRGARFCTVLIFVWIRLDPRETRVHFRIISAAARSTKVGKCREIPENGTKVVVTWSGRESFDSFLSERERERGN